MLDRNNIDPIDPNRWRTDECKVLSLIVRFHFNDFDIRLKTLLLQHQAQSLQSDVVRGAAGKPQELNLH